MESHHNFRLLLISLYLLVSFCLARTELSPDVSPSLQPDQSSPGSAPVPTPGPASVPLSSPESAPVPGPASVPSPSPSADAPSNYVSFPPSVSDPPSNSLFLDADASSELKPLSFDFSSMLASVKVDPELKNICDNTDHPSLCIATVAPFVGAKIDVQSVLEVAITAGTKFTEFVSSVAKKLAETPGTPPEIRSVLSDCKDSYDTALDNFEKTTTAFSEGDIGTMNSMLSAVITFVGDCEDALAGLGTDSPLSDYSDKLTNMTSNCLAMVSLMN